MKFVFFGYDFSLETALTLIENGHELIGVHSFPCDQVFSFNTRLKAFAESQNIPYTEEKPAQSDIDQWIKNGAELFLSVGYLFKIPAINPDKATGINIHPSMLPKGRSIMPIPHIIINRPEDAGITAHIITDHIDGGDILAQQAIKVTSADTVETLSNRIAMITPNMALDLVNNLPERIKNAAPQNEANATYFPAPDDAMRTINWDSTVATIKTLNRAFGRFGVLFQTHKELWTAYSLQGWEEKHDHKPGALCQATARDIVIAAKDGYICITEAEKIQSLS